jgi:hypothetical protein
MKFFIVIIIFLLALSLFLAMSVGVAFSLVWIFPAISFEIGVLIGTVSLGVIFYLFIKIISDINLNIISNTDFPSIDDDDIVDKIYDEIDLEHVIRPRVTRSRRKKR